MKNHFIKPTLVVLAALTASFTTPVPNVEAQSLFELLFNGNNRKNRRLQREQAIVQPRQQRRVVVKKPRIKAAQFYNYRPKALKKSNFSSLAKLAPSLGYYGPQTSQVDQNRMVFAEALQFVDGVDLRARADIAKAIITHYSENPEFIWVTDLKPNIDAADVIGVFSSADKYGLQSNDYLVKLPEFSPAEEPYSDVLAKLIKFEMKMSLRAVRYALDANGGVINPNKLSGYHDFPRKKLKPSEVLAKLHATRNRVQDNLVSTQEVTGSIQTASVDATNIPLTPSLPDNSSFDAPAQYLISLHPEHPAFATFVRTLAELRQTVDDAIVIDPDTFVRPGKSHAQIPTIVKAIKHRGSEELLKKYAVELYFYDGTETYTPDLVALVKGFQKENKLKPDGIIGSRTVSKMSDTPVATKINSIIVSMERLRWHPRKFGNRHVFINQPAYRATYLSGGREELSMRVVVGKRSNQTNFFYDKIEKVVYNPYWGVPRSILVNEMLPKLRRNPAYLDQRGYEVTTRSGRRISSASVDWYSVGANFGYNVRQTPGPKNALGELKILFPNKHSIYMHDTPAKSLFKRSKRALSHGCVRLKSPRAMAAAVLGTDIASVRSRLSTKRNNTQFLKEQVPVYVAYFTAWPSEAGEVQFYSDMYGRDRQLLKAIKKTASARADI